MEQEAIYDYFHELLAKEGSLPVWGILQDLAPLLERSGDVVLLIQKAMKTHASDKAILSTLESFYAEMLLVAGDVDTVVPIFINYLNQKDLPENQRDHASNIAEKLIKLGKLSDKPEWVEIGKAKILAFAREALKDVEEYSIDHEISKLLKLGLYYEGEQLILESANKLLKKAKSDQFHNYHTLNAFCIQLVHIYHETDRHEDIVYLLNNSWWWNQQGLALIHDHRGELYSMIAEALYKTGDHQNAVEVAKFGILKNPGKDVCYKILLEIEGKKMIPFLDRLIKDNIFEERPLIWKAQLLLNQNNFKEAELTARKAIAIDPSDGEQGKGDRMRAYAILAEILEKTNNSKDAALFRRVVKAIRISENADDYFAAGLYETAIKMYRSSLEQFSDAYCIQSRLAKRLTEVGKSKEAATHYRRAYELMPSSFGRVETHCFGCEGAFAKEKIAETVFLEMLKESPNNPVLHYLMGYLKSEYDRENESLGYYKKAVELDPLYLNAWKKILKIAEANGDFKKADESRIKIMLLTKDFSNFESIYNPKSQWEFFVEAKKISPAIPLPKTCYQIMGTATLEKINKKLYEQKSYSHGYNGGKEKSLPATPQEAITRNKLIQALIK